MEAMIAVSRRTTRKSDERQSNAWAGFRTVSAVCTSYYQGIRCGAKQPIYSEHRSEPKELRRRQCILDFAFIKHFVQQNRQRMMLSWDTPWK